jgi:hypothetical protein
VHDPGLIHHEPALRSDDVILPKRSPSLLTRSKDSSLTS